MQNQPLPNVSATVTPALPTTTTLADAALAYAAMGWSVFPLVPRAKEPLIKGGHGYKDATTDLAVVRQWWQQHPDANIGLAIGGFDLPMSDFVVLDVDPRKAGDIHLADLEAKHSHLPDTVEAITGNSGRHLFFQRPAVPIRMGTDAVDTGLDLPRYIVASPSIHPDTGRTYMWEASSEPGMVDLAPMPEWMVELLTVSAPRTCSHQSSTTLVQAGTKLGSTATRSDLDLVLARLLGIDRPVGAKFLCLLHREEHPSAWLFWGKGGDLLYHCTHFGGYTLTVPSVFASVQQGRIVRLKGGGEHYLHRVLPLYAAGLIGVSPILYMPLPEDAPPAAEAWYTGFIFTLALKGSCETAFSRRFAMRMTGLSEKDERAAAIWLLRHGYVKATGFYRAFGQSCNLLSLAPGFEFDDLEMVVEEGHVLAEHAEQHAGKAPSLPRLDAHRERRGKRRMHKAAA